MKVLFISDIHGIKKNIDFLTKLIESNKFDKIIVLGDIYYSGPSYDLSYEVDSKYVLTFLNSYKDIVIGVRGNCDSDVDIKVSDFPIYEDYHIINLDEINVCCSHGNKYSYSKNCDINYIDVLIYGHEHVPYIKNKDNIVYICAGSISLPRDGNLPTYVVYENRYFDIYDIDNNLIDSIKL